MTLLRLLGTAFNVPVTNDTLNTMMETDMHCERPAMENAMDAPTGLIVLHGLSVLSFITILAMVFWG